MSYTAINISAVIEGEIFLTGCYYQKIFLYLQQILHANHMTGLIIQCNMTKREISKLFEDRKIRTVWDDEQEKWYFSIVDMVGALVDSKDYQTARKYWNKLKQRLKEEGFEPVTNCHQLKLRAEDGKLRLTDVADTEQLFRIIQSIPSPKAEPIKQWMAPTVFTSSMSLPAWECGLKPQYYNKNLPATVVSFAKYQCSYNQSQQ